ncbi:MAG: DUF421 domain-containing protein [Pyrinomonadaceae bacterium]
MFAAEVHTFFDGWEKIGRSLILAVCAYGSLVLLLRISGKRTLAKMNVYDFVFVVALGSTLASTILDTGTTLADGVFAHIALIGLQYILSSLCVTSSKVDSIVNGEPTLVFHNGEFLWDTMRRERVSPEELRASARNDGSLSMDDIDSIVLETDGTFSVVHKNVKRSNSSLTDVSGHPTYTEEESVRHGSGTRRRQQSA